MSSPGTPQPQGATGSAQFQTHVGQIGRHSGTFFAGTVFTAALSYCFKVYLARVLGAEILGIYALGMTVIGFLGIFNALGLAQSAVRFVPAYLSTAKLEKLHALLWRAPAILLAANILLGAGLLLCGRWIAVGFYNTPALVRYLPLFVLIMLVGVLSSFYGKVLAGYMDVRRRTLIVNFVGSPLTMALAVVLLSMGWGLGGYLVAQIVASAVVGVLLILTVRQHTPEGARFSNHRSAPLEREVWSFSASMIGIVLMEFAMAQADKVALGYYRGAREVGIYSVAAALVVYVPVILSSVNQIFSPTIADLHAREQLPLLARLFQSLTKWVLALTLPLAIVMIVFSRPLMALFGPDFERGWPVLVIGTLGQLVNCGVGSVGYLLLMTGNEKRLIKVQAAMAAVTVVTSIALIPRWGIVGAAVASTVTNIGANVWNLLLVRRVLKLSPYNRGYVSLLPPTAIALIVALFLERDALIFHHAWLAVGVALVASYVASGATILVSGLDDDDRMIARAIWSRLRQGSNPVKIF